MVHYLKKRTSNRTVVENTLSQSKMLSVGTEISVAAQGPNPENIFLVGRPQPVYFVRSFNCVAEICPEIARESVVLKKYSENARKLLRKCSENDRKMIETSIFHDKKLTFWRTRS